MPRYRIVFYGCKIGQLNTAAKDRVEREVEAPDPAAAALAAYDTHEHIIGGADGVKVEEIKG